VLVELGYPGGRSGCRTVDEALDLVTRVNEAPQLRLRGVAGFEGLIPGPDLAAVLARSASYLEGLRTLIHRIDEDGLFPPDEELIVTAGGSSYFDLVVDKLGPESFERPTRTVLRSGCYVTHDAEMFELTSPLGARAVDPALRLTPALELWATVWSRPEPGLAIVGFGKRDAPYDYGFPLPERVLATGASGSRDVSGDFTITALNDQHAFMTIPPDDTLAVGDLVRCGISHPCGAFDKWKYLPVVDEDYNVIDGVFTFF
jgi:D-serine dehydratase